MFESKDCFEEYEKAQKIRIYYSQFKQSVIIQLEKLENQIEKIISKLSQRNLIDQVYENAIESVNSKLNDDEAQQLIQNWNKAQNEKMDEYFPRFDDQQVIRIQKTFKLWEQQIQELLYIDLEIIPRYSSFQYKFDTNAKFTSIKINEENIIEQTESQTHYCFSLVNQRLNQQETSSIQFKFPKFVGDIGVGICDKEILKSKDFRPQLNLLNNGSFICFQDSYTINTEKEEFNWKTKGFKYSGSDIIEVTYEPSLKKVSWKNVLKPNEGYSVILQNDKRELHFCCIVKLQGAQVEIVRE